MKRKSQKLVGAALATLLLGTTFVYAAPTSF